MAVPFPQNESAFPRSGGAAQPREKSRRESDPVMHARRINRTWITRGGLSESTESYFQHLEASRPEILRPVCEEAVQAAKEASNRCMDPKPAFYSSIFSRATKEERNRFLKNHFFTRLLSAEKQIQREGNPAGKSPRSLDP